MISRMIGSARNKAVAKTSKLKQTGTRWV